MVDFHNHLVPGVDDGAQTAEEAKVALEIFRSAGVTDVVVTPHVDASLTTQPEKLRKRLSELDAGYRELEPLAAEVGIRVARGVELLLDVPEPDLSDRRLRLAGGSFFLMEFPYMTVPPHSTRVLESLRTDSSIPIIAHPERYRGMHHDLDLAFEWRRSGALLQANAGSFLGRYGKEARVVAFELLHRGWIDYICSDYHARGSSLIGESRKLLISSGAAEQADTLMIANPVRMLRGEMPLPVSPLRERTTVWDRIRRVLHAS